jgi:hypothetical protein
VKGNDYIRVRVSPFELVSRAGLCKTRLGLQLLDQHQRLALHPLKSLHPTQTSPATMHYTTLLTLSLSTLISALPAPLTLTARSPPNIPSASEASSLLAGLRVAAQGPQTGYSRDLFPHWITQSGTCNTREVVLKRDGTGVVTDSACASTSGSWYSPYDGATWTAASDVDIDHMVPLSNAWKV